MVKQKRAIRLTVARFLSGLSYNFSALAYLIVVAVIVQVALQYYASMQPSALVTSAPQDLSLLKYSVQASVASTVIAIIVTFVIGALSLFLLVWVPYKVALIGSRMTQKISGLIFDNSTTARNMFVAKIVVYAPAVLLLIVLSFIFPSELMFQLLVVGAGASVLALVFAALRLVAIR